MNKHIKTCWQCGVPILIMEPTDHNYHLCNRCANQLRLNNQSPKPKEKELS